jgi:DNA-binding HxlR family transcriptional regulator
MVDYVLLASTAVIVFAIIILFFFLSRYRSLVNEANESTRLAKDVWDSMNSRFTVIDTRIIDLMARNEVLSAKSVRGQSQPPAIAESVTSKGVSNSVMSKSHDTPQVSLTKSVSSEGSETETRVLQTLLEGPKTSAQIKDSLGRSREHTSRLMKSLFEKGLVVRNSRNKPYVYELTDNGKSYLGNSTGK